MAARAALRSLQALAFASSLCYAVSVAEQKKKLELAVQRGLLALPSDGQSLLLRALRDTALNAVASFTELSIALSSPALLFGTLRVWRQLNKEGRRDLAYGWHARHRLDIHLPSTRHVHGQGLLPILIHVHGGAWAWHSKDSFSLLAQSLADSNGLQAAGYRGAGSRDGREEGSSQQNGGCMVVNINYRAYPHGSGFCMALDLLMALAWVHRHAESWGGDCGRVAFVGHSAGAHLCATAVTLGHLLAVAKVALVACQAAACKTPASGDRVSLAAAPLSSSLFFADAAAQKPLLLALEGLYASVCHWKEQDDAVDATPTITPGSNSSSRARAALGHAASPRMDSTRKVALRLPESLPAAVLRTGFLSRYVDTVLRVPSSPGAPSSSPAAAAASTSSADVARGRNSASLLSALSFDDSAILAPFLNSCVRAVIGISGPYDIRSHYYWEAARPLSIPPFWKDKTDIVQWLSPMEPAMGGLAGCAMEARSPYHLLPAVEAMQGLAGELLLSLEKGKAGAAGRAAALQGKAGGAACSVGVAAAVPALPPFPHFLFIHGGKDATVPLPSSQKLHERICQMHARLAAAAASGAAVVPSGATAAAPRSCLLSLPQTDHFSHLLTLMFPAQQAVAAALPVSTPSSVESSPSIPSGPQAGASVSSTGAALEIEDEKQLPAALADFLARAWGSQ